MARPEPSEPTVVELRYHYHRARRRQRIVRREETRLARYRFSILLTALLACAIAFVVGAWHEIQHLFGL